MVVNSRVAKFILIGGLCLFIQWCAVHVLRHWAHPFVADTIGFTLSAQLNFALSRSYTWSDRKGRTGLKLLITWFYYNGALIFSAIGNALIFWTLLRFGEVPALACAAAGSALFSYTVNNKIVFGGTKNDIHTSGAGDSFLPASP